MRLALLGSGISHSLSPSLYREMLGEKLETYELLDIKEAALIPTLAELAGKLDGLSITAPWKKHFLDQVLIDSELVRAIGAINTISFSPEGPKATNTDAIATHSLLEELKLEIPGLRLILLGSGSMARMTILIARELRIPLQPYSRSQGHGLKTLDLSDRKFPGQTVVINACSRDFVFEGRLHPSQIFWDYNYRFIPHQNTLPSQVKRYVDGEELLRRQAKAALEFWRQNQPLQHKC